MLKNIFLKLEYDGTNYFGWQIQNKKSSASKACEISSKHSFNGQPTIHPQQKEKTVGGELEKALKKLFNQDIRIIHSSRTDRGVHAKAQCVNFQVETSIALKNIKSALNSFLPTDIIIKKIKEVPLGFHARFSAKSKVYRYVIYNTKENSVFERKYSWFIPEKLDLERIRKAADVLKGKKDFFYFARDAKKYKTCLRNLIEISIKRKGKFIYIELEADGFLRNMVRNIVFFLILVGKGSIPLRDIKGIINRKLNYTKKPAPGYGLYLMKVNYEKF